MRLIRAKVNGFGRLRDFTVDYGEGITSLCMENGWGKTTLAYFHKAMFYGLDPSRTAKERERFKPWEGDAFGGWLEFSTDTPEGEKAYRIQRSFGDRPAKDQFRLYSLPDLRESGDFPDPVGLSLFGLNARSFLRTIFCTGLPGTPPESPDSALLAEKFGDNPANGKMLEKTLNRLEDRRVELQTRRGDNGKIPALRREMLALDRQIEDCRLAGRQAEEHRAALERVSGQIGRDQAEIDEIREKIDRYSQSAALLERNRTLKARVAELEGQESETRAFFREGECSEDALNRLQGKADEVRLARRYAEQTALPFEDDAEYQSLSARFPGGLPDEEALRDHREIEEKLTLGRRREREIRESAEFRRRSVRFADTFPEEEMIDHMLVLAQTPEGPEKRILRLVPALIGLILAGGGVLGWILSDSPIWTALSVLLIVAGAALTVLFGILYFKNAGKKEETSPLTAFLAAYGLPAEDVLSELHELRLDAAAYREDLEKLVALDRENQALSDELAEFLDYYHAPDRKTLEGWVDRCLELDSARKAHAQRAESARQRAAALTEELSGMLSCYPVDPGDPAAVAEIRDRAGALRAAQGALVTARQAAADFAAQHPDLREDSDGAPADANALARLRERESELSARLDAHKDACRREETALSECAGQADRLPGLMEERQNRQELLEQASALLSAIERAEIFLEKASQNLSDRYLSGVQERFADYLKKLTPDAAEQDRYRLNGSLAVLSEEGGGQRGSDRLSAGKQDMTALCLRFALADTLMGGKADFLILDDPFAHLDDTRVDCALTLLCDLAKDRQILYLTCSHSRMPRLEFESAPQEKSLFSHERLLQYP